MTAKLLHIHMNTFNRQVWAPPQTRPCRFMLTLSQQQKFTLRPGLYNFYFQQRVRPRATGRYRRLSVVGVFKTLVAP